MFVGSEETLIILQNTLLTGIQNVSFSYTASQQNTMLLSNKGINRRIHKPQVASCSITKNYLGLDFLKELTGFAGLSGQFIYGSNALDFTDAAISNYTISMKPNTEPQISVNFEIFGDLSPTTNLKTGSALEDNDIRQIDEDSIYFDFLNKNSAIDGFNFSTNFIVEPTYEIDSVKSSNIKILPPVSHSVSAEIEMTEQEYEDVTGLLESENYDRSFSLSFVDRNAIKDVQVQEERYNSFISNGVPLGLDYGRYNIDFTATGFAKLDTFLVSGLGLKSQKISISTKDTIKLNVSYDGFNIHLPTGDPSNNPSGQIQPKIDEIKSKVDEAIKDFDLFINLPKITGDDFENALEGTGFSNNGMIFSLRPDLDEENFESRDTSVIPGDESRDLYLLGVLSEKLETFTPETYEINFELTNTGITDRNLIQLSS